MPPNSPQLGLNDDSVAAVVKAMAVMFTNKGKDLYPDYANALCLLSDSEKVQGAFGLLEEALRKAVNAIVSEKLGKVTDGTAAQLIDLLDNDRLICDAATFTRLSNTNRLPLASVSVSKVLKRTFPLLGVTDLLTDAPSAVFSDAASQHFVGVVSKGGLFVDGVTAGHGEFTHTIQWLLVAAAAKGSLIPLTHSVGVLYKAAVGLATAEGMLYEKPGEDIPFGPKTMWDLVVDCFLTDDPTSTKSNVGKTKHTTDVVLHDDFERSLYATNFRSPRLLQYGLFGGIPEKRFEHHGWFLAAADVPTHAPLLCALLRNRHRHKSLTIDMDEGMFQKVYIERAEAKAAARKVAEKKYGPHNPFLEVTGAKQDHKSFIPTGEVKPPKK